MYSIEFTATDGTLQTLDIPPLTQAEAAAAIRALEAFASVEFRMVGAHDAREDPTPGEAGIPADPGPAAFHSHRQRSHNRLGPTGDEPIASVASQLHLHRVNPWPDDWPGQSQGEA